MTTQSDQRALLITRDGPVVTITLNRPHRRNAVTSELLGELGEFFAECRRDRECKVILLRGAGEHFCVGLDLVDAGEGDDLLADLMLGDWGITDILRAMRSCPQPVIALVNGSVAGAGLIFALHSDIIIASEGAFFTTAFINLGLSGTELGVAWWLQRTLGLSLAREMAFTSSRFEAQSALATGMVSAVVAPGQLEAEGRAMAGRIAAHDLDALRITKRNLDLALQSPLLETSYELEERAQMRRVASGSLEKAVAAFNTRKSNG
jgi:enoyl-CoA hydratase/carnithine racemase